VEGGNEEAKVVLAAAAAAVANQDYTEMEPKQN
jgi:hypothetical protein